MDRITTKTKSGPRMAHFRRATTIQSFDAGMFRTSWLHQTASSKRLGRLVGIVACRVVPEAVPKAGMYEYRNAVHSEHEGLSTRQMTNVEAVSKAESTQGLPQDIDGQRSLPWILVIIRGRVS